MHCLIYRSALFDLSQCSASRVFSRWGWAGMEWDGRVRGGCKNTGPLDGMGVCVTVDLFFSVLGRKGSRQAITA